MLLAILIVLFLVSGITTRINAEDNFENNLFENIEQTDEGYLISHKDMILLAEYIEELHATIDELDSELEDYKIQLEEERNLADRVIESKDETIALQEQQIEEYQAVLQIQEEQIALYEEIVDEYKSISEKHLERIRELERTDWRRNIRSALVGTGLTSTLILIALVLSLSTTSL